MAEFVDGWRKEHRLSQPLTGAIFDVFVDIFHEQLLDRGLITPAVEDLADYYEYQPQYQSLVQEMFDQAYTGQELEFKAALVAARDIMGNYLAELWRRLPPNYLSYQLICDILREVDADFSGGEYRRIIDNNFKYRDIGLVTVGPQLAKLPRENHMDSARRMTPGSRELAGRRKLPYRERMRRARQIG
jgi:hypothetical protein